MQLYFIKSTYTNNVYKISDFWFNSTTPNVSVNKLLNINFKPDDGLTSFITSQLELPDETSIRDHTHIYVYEYEKFYKIISIDVMNKEQWLITVDEDPFIANYQDLKSEDLIITRTNDAGEWRGVNDIADMTLKEETTVTMINSDFKTGKWALLFFQLNQEDDYIGLKFETYSLFGMESFATITALTTAYPEVSTTSPEKYTYFQKFALVSPKIYQCVYNSAGGGALKWVEATNDIPESGDEILYLKVNNPDAGGVRTNLNDFFTIVVAMPIECDLFSEDERPILSYKHFLGPVDTNLIDIKIVNDLVFNTDAITYDLTDRVMEKTITFTFDGGTNWQLVEEDDGTDTPSGWDVIQIGRMKDDIDLSHTFWTPGNEPIYSEPFYKYDLYVYGKKFSIPYYLTDDLHLLIAMTSGVCNYIIYYKDPENILASGSFTHSVRYSIDQLDAFYSQNPTYKEQFFTKMAIDSVKNIVGGAVAGSVVPGIGTIAGAIGGAVASGVDAGVGLINLHYQEKGLRLKPDQSFGEISEVALQTKYIFGIYWVMKTSENKDLMRSEFDLKGFPTSLIASIDDLTAFSSSLFGGTTKIVFGELKTVIKNEYVTSFINQKLKEGVVLK